MGGGNKVPIKVQDKVTSTGGELVPNLLLLGWLSRTAKTRFSNSNNSTDKASVITTSQGIRIAALGGQYDPASYSSPKYASIRVWMAVNLN
jgi:hypothetical protein